MKTFNKLIGLALVPALLFGCSKAEDPILDPATTAVSGKISYKLNGKAVTQDGSGYLLKTDYSFVKWENSKEQLSMDFYGMASGTYTIVDNMLKTKGNARIYYIPDSSPGNTTQWIAKTGTFIVTAYSMSPAITASGTFTATLEKSVAGTFTGEKMEITEGIFKDIVLKDIR